MKTRTRILLAIFIILLSANAFAATYYVRTNGSDSNSGTSPDAPWAHCPGMSGWSGSATLNAGDTVYFRSEDTWNLTPLPGGAADWKLVPGVTFYGNSWGSGTRARIHHSSGSLYTGIVGWEADHASIPGWFEGFEVDSLNVQFGTGGGFWFGGYDQASDMNGAKKTIKNCVIHDLPNDQLNPDWTYAIWFRPYNAHFVKNVDVLNCLAYNTGSDLIALYPVGSDCYIDTILVRGCESYNGGLKNVGTGASILIKNDVRNATIEFNYSHDSSQGITLESDSVNSQTNIIVRYNIVRNTKDMPGIHFQGGYTGARSVEVYDNLIFNNGDCGIRLDAPYGGVSDSVKFYNNTVYNNATAATWGAELYISAPSFSHSYDVRNNILYSTRSQEAFYETQDAAATHKNNAYYKASGTLAVNGSAYYGASNITSFEPTAISAAPGFKNPSNLPTGFVGTYGVDLRPNADGLSIVSGSCLDSGDGTLRATYNKAINTAGYASPLTRPQGAGWDIGAYEYSGTPQALSPPTNLRVIGP